jgi:hypothetical protein
MHYLLAGAVSHALAMGAPALEGYPVYSGIERVDQTSGYVGTVQVFEAHGFKRVRQDHWATRRQIPLAHALRATMTARSPAPDPPRSKSGYSRPALWLHQRTAQALTS